MTRSTSAFAGNLLLGWRELLGWQATGRHDASTPFYILLGFQSWGIIQLSSLNN